MGSNLDKIRRIETRPQSRSVVLTAWAIRSSTGRPRPCDRLGKDRFEVMPHVSAMQMAFARVKESWEEAFLTNLASHGVPQVLEQIRGAEKVERGHQRRGDAPSRGGPLPAGPGRR